MTAALVMYSLDAALASDLTKSSSSTFPISWWASRSSSWASDGPRRVAQRADWGRQPRTAGGQAPGHTHPGRNHPPVERGGPGARGIGRAIVPSAMLILLAGVTFALALAVGLGTRTSSAMDRRPGQPAHAGRCRRDPALVAITTPAGRRDGRGGSLRESVLFWIHVVMVSSAAGAIVTSIWAYSAGDPVLAG